MIRAPKESSDAAIEITPMIDMVFLLLIFFLIATTFHQTEREIQVALPSAASGGPISASLREIIVNVTAEGEFIVNGRAMAPDDLAALIADSVELNPEQKVTVRGDRACAWEGIVRALDICKGNGVPMPYLDTVATNVSDA
jgi:biopolymer transport protein ExbD